MSRPALNKIGLGGYRVKPETLEKLKSISIEAGYIHGNGAAIGQFLDAIAQINPIVLIELTKSSQTIDE
ncbi:hypothetical protein [Chamaesiphon sp. VAR_48_metabat_403]|uniref:hypothetical protein n=1 Tax=Chamaesiphon sp. VAR_48_metabat_403 TaxID=2964700 RepID=UPI00286E6B17|nr:hypothetical protein [Chamaesiphon sp. VAR_48_metabat_403]